MTPAEALRAAVAENDEVAARELLAGRSETERADLVQVAREIVAAEVKKGLGAVGRLGPTLLIAYGILPVADIRKLGWRSNHFPKGLEAVLRQRSPERLGPIVDHILDDVGHRGWAVVRPLVRDGIVPRPDRPSYTIAMLAATRYRGRAIELVASDPGLLEVEAWRLFEVEGGGEDSLANHEKFFGDSWGTVFRELAASDPAARQRLLDASLAALARDFATYRAGWFSRFHESLAPTDEERSARADAYLRLLRSRVGPTVSFAVAALNRVARAGRLPPDALLDRIGPVLVEGSAGSAKGGLELIGRAASGSPDGASRAALAATDALANASPEVQRAAIALIGRLVSGTDDAVARALEARLPEVAASQRLAAAGLLARLGGGTSRSTADEEPGVANKAPSTPPASSRPSPIDPGRAIRPIASIEELVNVAVSVLEAGEPADDLERVLDAVGRFSADRPEGFSRLMAPIAKRARTILARRESAPFTGFDPRADVAAILLAWGTGELAAPNSRARRAEPGAGVFLSARAREVAEAAAARRPFVAVAVPTHRGGWLDPGVLVARLADHEPASHLDLVAALLRLAPGRRGAALRAAAGVGGEAGAAVRYALGGTEPVGPTAAWWVAAARVRAPGQDDDRVEVRHPGLGPDGGRAARVRLGVRDPKRYIGGIGLEVEPEASGETGVDLPTVLMHRHPTMLWSPRSQPSMLRWIATIQPGYREAWAAAGLVPLATNVDWWSAEWANRVYLEPFIDPVTAIGRHGRLLIALALGSKEAGERGLASDVVRLALADGRLTASTLAEGLTAAADVACDRPQRWALALGGVAASSAGHAVAVAEAIARSLPAVAGRPAAGLVPLLRLLDELLAGIGGTTAEDGRPALTSLGAAGGQAGRLARSILGRS